jgi:two-component system, NarL family, sensor kinase
MARSGPRVPPEPATAAEPLPEGSTAPVEILARVARSLLETDDFEQQLALTLSLATEALRAGRGSVMVFDPELGELTIRCAHGLPPEAIESRHRFGEGISGWVAANREPVLLHGGVLDERFEGSDPSIGSSLSLPLAVGGTTLGVLNLVRRTDEHFTEEDLRLASSLADLASVAIEKAQLHNALRERESRVSDLLAAVIRAQEQERRKIAGDIHDGFLQDLSALFLRAEIARSHVASGQADQAEAVLTSLQEMVRSQMKGIRDFILEVRPPALDEVGVGPTVRMMVEQIAQENGIAGHFDDRTGPGRLPRPLETIIYRTAQEALRNVVLHAKAKQVWVDLSRGDRDVTLSIRDDGRGITPRQPTPGERPNTHYGIDTMRERVELTGGRLRIGTWAGGGTEVLAVIPLDAAD